MSRAEGPQQAEDDPQASPACWMCGGTRWLQLEDPFLGGYLDAACPECEDTHEQQR